MQRLEDTSTTFNVGVAMFAYSLCSSSLLLANKLAMVHLPLPTVVSFMQIIFSTIQILIMKYIFGVKVDELEWDKIKAYAVYIVAFVLSIYANMKALALSNVETVIVFRACVPVCVTVIEYFLMDRALPSVRSAVSLAIVSIGAIMYCLSDSEFALNGLGAYTWAIIYFFLISFEMTYGKQLVNSVKMDSVWGPVLYCNILAALPMFLLGYASGDYNGISDKLVDISTSGLLILLFSCIVGTLIGYTSWLCRGMVSATTFSLVGVINKFLTVLLNVLIWDKHSSTPGLIAVSICLLAGAFYQQAPKRSDLRKEEAVDTASKGLVDDVKLGATEPLLAAVEHKK